MKEEFQYRSTPDGSPPSGYKRKGTFRDVTLHGNDPKTIDDYDMECIEKGITRRQLANVLMGHPENGGDPKRFNDIFSNTNYYTTTPSRKKSKQGVNQVDAQPSTDLTIGEP